MAEITIVVSPSFDRRGNRRLGRFDVRLQDCDEVICKETQQPLLDASRVLLRRGSEPSTVICKVSVDAPAVIRMKAPIGVAAQYDVMGSAFVRRKLTAGPMPGSGIENEGSAEPRVPCETKANAGAPHKGSRQAATPPSPISSAAASPALSVASRYRQKEK
jgi:hypothetical protein